MAIIGKIRNRLGGIIAIFIGLAMALFILETALNSNSNLLKGNKDIVGVIDGNKIHYRDFESRVDETVRNYKLQTSQANVDENTMFSLREQTWNQMVTDAINGSEYKKLGITVSPDELKDMFMGKDPIPEIKQAFTNPQTGIFDPMSVKNYIENLDRTGEGEQEGERRERWVAFEKAAKENRLLTKYQNLISKAMYIPKWQAETDYNEKNTRAAVRFVMVPYNSITDSSIKVTDAELQEYLNKNKEKFKQEESRQVQYVIFPVKPSKEDTVRVKKDIDDIYAALVAAPGDTNLLKLNADNGLDRFYYKKENVSSVFVQDTIFKVPVGTLLGPYFEDGSYRLAMLMDRRDVPDSVRSRHILIRAEPGADTTVARKKIDSIYAAFQAGASFDSLAMKFSDDKGSGQNGGDLGFLAQGVVVRNMDKFLFFDGKQGEAKIVKTEFGYHLVEIVEVKDINPAVRVVFITRPLEASSETDKIVFDQATIFASSNQTEEQFIKSSEDQKLNKQMAPTVQKNAYQLPGLDNAREVVKWSFQAPKGEVSPVFSLGTSYVVAVVTGIKEEGTMTVEDARQQLETAVRKEKKSEQIVSQLSAEGAMNATLESIGTKVNQPVKTSGSVVFANAYAESLGYEPKVIGTIFSLKENTTSKPLAGEQGVFVVNIQSITQPQPVADYNSFKQQLLGAIQPRLQYGVADALKKSIKIQDDRYLFF